MNNKYYFLQSLGLSKERVKHVLDATTTTTTEHNNNVSFWMTCNLSEHISRARALKLHHDATHKVASGNNKKASTAQLEKNALNKALEDAKKKARTKKVQSIEPKKLRRLAKKSIYETGLFNHPFDVSALRDKIEANILDENTETGKTERALYVALYERLLSSGKVYKRARLERTLKEEKARALKKRDEASLAEADNEFYMIPVIEKLVPEATNIQYCDNDFMNYALNNHLAERIVSTKLLALYRGTVNKKTGELSGGNLDALRLLYGENMPLNKEDLIQALNLHLWECALSGEYCMEDNEPDFDIMACFRVIDNTMYSFGNQHGKYKLVHHENELEQIDEGYLEKGIEDIDIESSFGNLFRSWCKSYVGGKDSTFNLCVQIMSACISGYKYKAIANYLDISEDACNKLVKRYIKPFLLWYATYYHHTIKTAKKA